jgi:hypothetical protein
MVSERCRSPPPEICGDTATAISKMVTLAAMDREVESLARSSGTCVIAADREP